MSEQFEAPMGPSSATDFTEDGRILCFDERNNRIVVIDRLSRRDLFFSVGTVYSFQHYYWAQIFAIGR